MASFSAGTTFTDGVANDVTAAKLGALVNNATPTSGLIQDRTTETIVGSNDTLLLGDASDSNNLKKMTVANVFKSELTGTINSTSGTITTATIPTLVATTLVTTGTGTAASPAIVPTGDTNTGIFFPAADTIAFSDGGTESVRIDSSGNVGIGTTIPATKLTVSGTNGTNSELRVVSTGANTGGRVTLYENTAGCWEFTTSAGANSSLTVKDLFNNTERLRINSSGNVGIGITSPNQKLVVVGASSDTETIRVITGSDSGTQQTTGIGFAFSTTATNPSALIQAEEFDTSDARANIVFSTNNTGTDVAPTERMRISSAGNVSIGTATALSTLHVHGNLTLSNTTTATSAGTGGLSKPATYAGYLTVSINGTSRKIPYYAT